MNFLADENIDKAIVDTLRLKDHTVQYVAEMNPGISDEEILKMAQQRKAILLTADKDFIEFFFHQGKLPCGAILIRLSGLSSEYKAPLVARAIQDHAKELFGNFTVLTPNAIRIRKSIYEP